MEANEYQKQAGRTLVEKVEFEISNNDQRIIWNAVGLAGETGEVVDHVKKGILHQHGLNVEKLSEELGDVLWYVAAMCTTLGLDMSEVMQQNVDKLKRRYPEGYSSSDSQKRVDVASI